MAEKRYDNDDIIEKVASDGFVNKLKGELYDYGTAMHELALAASGYLGEAERAAREYNYAFKGEIKTAVTEEMLEASDRSYLAQHIVRILDKK